MELLYQSSSLNKLQIFAKNDIHSILISGISGSGKTFLAKQYSKFLNISTFNVIDSKVSNLKEAIENSYKLSDLQVICIENLDKGTQAAAQVILKYLEEPLPNVYIIVTCVNSLKLPSTILSRVLDININPPSKKDLNDYSYKLNKQKYEIVSKHSIWSIVKSLNDVKTIFDMTLDQINYYDYILEENFWKVSSDQLLWNLSHYQDNTRSNIIISLKLIQRAFSNNAKYQNISRNALEALLAFEEGKLSETAILGKFILNSR